MGKLIKDYCAASGQHVNLLKFSVFFGANIPISLKDELEAVLGMPAVENPWIYLGVPAIWGRSKK